ncbi:lytic transglycosylase domain-containing protein [Enteractinococcus coprophilus]|nr:lytic transglycosylase domain-containing protein [Enteractinococcus coprophilus]
MTDRTSGASRFYKSAVATSALPLLALGSATAAPAAVADAPSTALSPKSATAANLTAAQQQLESALIPADQVAVALPARFTQQHFQAAKTSPTTYKVKSGETLGHIALKHKVSLSNLLKWNELKASSTIYPGDVLHLGPTSASSSAPRNASSTSSSDRGTYNVKAGDTLSAIAVRNGISLSTLLNANGLSMSSVIYPGQSLKLSGSSSSAAPSKSSKSSASSSGGTYNVKSGDTLSGIAAKNNVSLSTLLNANGLSQSSIIYPGQQLKLSGSASNSSSSKSTSGTSSSNASSYTVKAGDTLSGIAARNGVSLSTILKANGLSLSSTIFPGQNIKLSGTGASSSSTSTKKASSSSNASSYTVKAGDTLSGIAARNGVSVSTILKANGLSSSSIIFPGQTLKLSGTAASSSSSGSSSSSSGGASKSAGTYTVKSGDTLSGIAARNGISLSTLLQANSLSRTSVIYPGQKLKLSGSGGSGSVSTASSGNDDQLVGNTFLHYTYPDHVVANANANKRALLAAPMPSRETVRQMVRNTAASMDVDPRLAMAHAQVESGFDPAAVSPANAIGTMQVIPSSGEWASQLVGRKLNLLDPQDNITAGVAIIRHLQRNNPGDIGIAGYYQGEGGVRKYGMYPDTKDYVAKVKNTMSRF